MISVSLCGQVQPRGGKLFLRNPDGMFEVHASRKTRAALLDLSGQIILAGGTMRTHKAGSVIDLETYQLATNIPDRADHLNTLLQISLAAF